MTHRIALIHATRVAIDPIEAALSRLWPEARAFSILEESLAVDRASGAASLEELDRRIVALCRYTEALQPHGILYTCSSFGAGIEEAARLCPVPVLKPNEAMFDQALAHGHDIVMLYTFPPAVDGMSREFQAEVAIRGAKAQLRPIFVPDALDALQAGDAARHDALIAEAAATVGQADAIMLAQFSMASAGQGAQALTPVPVLSSPDAAVEHLKARILAAQHTEQGTC
ncbi:aspartate/glutamate racemase family protein [Paracoccus rhizosphaerae]|uniref:Aspartate/glutamate racemase family protein n=1 Tax=Paracoccus rhizosphaerae TaxID=1133347 RepID=A0ABV6CGB7_9RHOB|nr:aspartate/glutamate racemase family protein [Paracoccus rhizosphaerae]